MDFGIGILKTEIVWKSILNLFINIQ